MYEEKTEMKREKETERKVRQTDRQPARWIEIYVHTINHKIEVLKSPK